MARFSDELADINTVSTIYDTLQPIISKKVKESLTFQKFLKVFRNFASKNDTKLNTNIMGRQIILNQSAENDVLDAFGVTRDQVKDLIVESPYFKKFGKELALTDQLCLAIPLIIASLEYHRLNKKEESSLIYMFAFFKPYSSRESVFFKFGVNEGQMLYTIERDLTDRFDLKRQKTIFLSIKKQSESSYANYIEPYKSDQVMTDKELHIIYNSGIATRMNHFIGGIVEKYRQNAGKSLAFDNAAAAVLDKDDDSSDFEDADIQSDAAVKNTVINKTLNKITKDPVDKNLILLACQSTYGTSARNYTTILSSVVDEIIDNMFDKLYDFFSALIGSFLFHEDPSTKRVYTMADFKTPVFLNVGTDILAGKKSHLKDKNMIKAREIFGQMLDNYSEEYRAHGETYRRDMRKALANYWVYVVKTANN